MQFTHTWPLVLAEEKTQTRRLVRAGEYTWVRGELGTGPTRPSLLYSEICRKNNSRRFVVGKTYAVQPGRGRYALWWKPGRISDIHNLEGFTIWDEDCIDKPDLTARKAAGFQEARVTLTALWREDVRRISIGDLEANGFNSLMEFLLNWTGMYDRKAYDAPLTMFQNDTTWLDYVDTRPATCYMAWALAFELVKWRA